MRTPSCGELKMCVGTGGESGRGKKCQYQTRSSSPPLYNSAREDVFFLFPPRVHFSAERGCRQQSPRFFPPPSRKKTMRMVLAATAVVILVVVSTVLAGESGFVLETQTAGSRHNVLYTRAATLSRDKKRGVVLVDTASRRVALGCNGTQVRPGCSKSMCARIMNKRGDQRGVFARAKALLLPRAEEVCTACAYHEQASTSGRTAGASGRVDDSTISTVLEDVFYQILKILSVWKRLLFLFFGLPPEPMILVPCLLIFITIFIRCLSQPAVRMDRPKRRRAASFDDDDDSDDDDDWDDSDDDDDDDDSDSD